jgi:predicted molibdopterin-dependent oxidoreductase YjgC
MTGEGIITLNVDGEDIKARQGQTILEAARSAEIYIPSLCYYPGLKPLPQVILNEACQLCIVEANGDIVLSCVAPVSERMVVKARTAKVRELQQKTLLAVLARQPIEIHPVKKDCELQKVINYIGLKEITCEKKGYEAGC